jgi:transglutaminase-like putative cysteine protease
MTLTPQRRPASADPSRSGTKTAGAQTPVRLAPGEGGPGRNQGAGLYPWAMAASLAVAVGGAALSLNGVLRGWAWYSPVLTTIVVVVLAMAILRSLRTQPLLVAGGGFAALVLILTFIFFRQRSIAGFIPSAETMEILGPYLRRASETVLSESAPVAPNAAIVLVTCAVLGLVVILVDSLALPLAMPATSGLGLLAILVVPAMIKPQSVGVLAFVVTAVGYLLIMGCSQWFAPFQGLTFSGRNPGQLKRAVLTGGVALLATLILQPAVPGFDRGTFPQGSRLNPWGSSNGLNPMISLGNSLRSPTGDGRITYASTSTSPLYLRSVTVDRFDGDSWAPDDRDESRRIASGRMDAGHEISATDQRRYITAINTGQFTSPYLPAPYAPEAVNGIDGRWSWDPATLSIKAIDTNSRNQQYVVVSTVPVLTAELLARSSAPVRGISEDFLRPPAGVPDIVRTTTDTVTDSSRTPYAKAMAIQSYLRSPDFTYSLESPVQGGYDGNGLSVLADFLAQKSGYCIHYASAMAVMARLEGIPSRIAVGYAPGRPTGGNVSIGGQGAVLEYEVDARDAHAWPELYFQGLGWVPFEPTPSRGVVPSYATDASGPGGASTNENTDDLIPSGAATAAPLPSAAPVPVPGAGGVEGYGGPLLPILYGTLAALLFLLLLASPRMVRSAVRSGRIRAGGTAGYAAAPWAELQDLATDYGVPPDPSETPRHFSIRLRQSGALGEEGDADSAAHAAVQSLTQDFERSEYGPPEPHDSSTDGVRSAGTLAGLAAARIDVIIAALRANAHPLVRLRALWLPPAVTNRWRTTAGTPFRAVARRAAAGRAAIARAWSRTRDGLRRVREG